MSIIIPFLVTFSFIGVLAGGMGYDLIKHSTKDLPQEISEIAKRKGKISAIGKAGDMPDIREGFRYEYSK